MTFEACHKLPAEECYGVCQNLHGHSYKLETIVEGSITDRGWIMNFKDLKALMKKYCIDIYDHNNLNEFFNLPTAEIMVEQIARLIGKNIDLPNVASVTCRLWETATSYAEFTHSLKQ